MVFLVTENMIGNDFKAVQRCFDLKGSLYHRITEIDDEEEKQGSGIKVLKDLNFKNGDNKLSLKTDEKEELFSIIEKDS